MTGHDLLVFGAGAVAALVPSLTYEIAQARREAKRIKALRADIEVGRIVPNRLAEEAIVFWLAHGSPKLPGVTAVDGRRGDDRT